MSIYFHVVHDIPYLIPILHRCPVPLFRPRLQSGRAADGGGAAGASHRGGAAGYGVSLRRVPLPGAQHGDATAGLRR